jgi:hypothetical protein
LLFTTLKYNTLKKKDFEKTALKLSFRQRKRTGRFQTTTRHRKLSSHDQAGNVYRGIFCHKTFGRVCWLKRKTCTYTTTAEKKK